MKHIIPLLLLLTLLLSACAAPAPVDTAPPTAPTQAPTEPPTEAPTQAPTEPPTEAPTQAPTEPPVLYRNPLTGVPQDAPTTLRPYAVSINNVKAAMPQHGLSQAEMVYEMPVEGGATRCLAVFTNIAAVEKLGAVRSARIYTVSLARGLDAILVRAGGSSEADAALANLGWSQINAVNGYAANVFYRDQDRLNSKYALEHTLFTDGNSLIGCAESRGVTRSRDHEISYGLTFAEDGTPNGEAAETITVYFGTTTNTKSSTMRYDTEAGKYLASQYETDWIDGNTGEPLAFENVLILHADTWLQADGVHKSIQLVGKGKGYFACGGKIAPISWSRSSDSAPFVYTYTDGTPVSLGIGTGYVAIIPSSGIVDCGN